jgi:RNA polymerase sigma factor (sigma-70 family)
VAAVARAADAPSADPTFSPRRGSVSTTVPVEDPLVDLARGAVAGNRDALDELVRELEPTVVRAVRLIVGSGSWSAEDAAQEALIDVTRGIGSLRDPRAVKTWALRVATSRALKIARRERLLALRRSPMLAELAAEPPDTRSADLKAAFDRLPPRLRATAVLRLYVGLSEAETAEVLGCSTGTVKSNLHDARKRLGQTLGERGLAPATSERRSEETV